MSCGELNGCNVLVHRNASLHYRPTFQHWFGVALRDPSAFYITLSNAALELARLQKSSPGCRPVEDREALAYYNLSLKHAQERLCSTDEGILGGVLGFACRDVSCIFRLD
jgi:hypothetical protein